MQDHGRVDELFSDWKAFYGKVYSSPEEVSH
jgi:hypothetical protein